MRQNFLFGVIALLGMVPAFAAADNVEIVLEDKLDGNLNGYCIDIMGGGQNIDPSRGLQAHTCYSYRGDLGPDQAVDPASITEGKIHIVGFDVCATMEGLDEGAAVALSACDDNTLQQFNFAHSGNISPLGAPNMCLTAGKETTFGRNGTSPHQIKTLSLQACSDELAGYQQWTSRTQAAYDSQQAK